jgi:hypothetical protein
LKIDYQIIVAGAGGPDPTPHPFEVALPVSQIDHPDTRKPRIIGKERIPRRHRVEMDLPSGKRPEDILDDGGADHDVAHAPPFDDQNAPDIIARRQVVDQGDLLRQTRLLEDDYGWGERVNHRLQLPGRVADRVPDIAE